MILPACQLTGSGYQLDGPYCISVLTIEKGADINTKNNLGMTPLHIATRVGRKDIVELLITKGADVNIKNNAGLTPIDLAKGTANTEIVELLRRNGAKE